MRFAGKLVPDTMLISNNAITLCLNRVMLATDYLFELYILITFSDILSLVAT